MDQNIIAVFFMFGLIPTLIFMFLIFRFIMKNRERMAMIEKGLVPVPEAKADLPRNNVKTAFMVSGVGFGVLVGHLLQRYLGMEDPFGYLSMAFLFGGIGLIVYYLMASKGKFQNN